MKSGFIFRSVIVRVGRRHVAVLGLARKRRYVEGNTTSSEEAVTKWPPSNACYVEFYCEDVLGNRAELLFFFFFEPHMFRYDMFRNILELCAALRASYHDFINV